MSILALITACFTLSGLINDPNLRPILKLGYVKKDGTEKDEDKVRSDIVWMRFPHGIFLVDRYNSDGLRLTEMFGNNHTMTEHVLLDQNAYIAIRVDPNNIDDNNRLRRRLNAGFALRHPLLIPNWTITSGCIGLSFERNNIGFPTNTVLLKNW